MRAPLVQSVAIAAALLVVSPASAGKCAAPPLNLPYRDVSVVPGVLHRGIALQIGSPWQSVALVPSLQINDTFLTRYTNTCISDVPITTTQARRNHVDRAPATKTLAARNHDASPGLFSDANSTAGGEDGYTKCAQLYGGAYNPSLSSSSGGNKQDDQGLHFLTDMWRFGDYLDVYTTTNDALPAKSNITSTFQIAQAGETFSGYGSALLGLTPNSTLLEALVQAQMVPSTSWTLTNESLCLGCGDAALSTGAWHTFVPSDIHADPKLPCLIHAKVEALNWRPRKGTEGATLIQETFTACIDPGVKFMVLPSNASDTFKKVVGRKVKAEYDDYTVFNGPATNETGTLSFRIEGGLEVNVSLPGAGEAAAEQDGMWTVPVGKGGWGAYGNETWVLGKPFTDRVVLRWDGEKKEYGIANRNTDPTPKPDMLPLGCDAFPNVEKSVTSTPGTGILVGSVVGGFVGGLAFAFAGFWFFKRGQKGVKSRYAQLDEDSVPMRAMSQGENSWRTTGALTPPPPSIHESLRSQRFRDTRQGTQSGPGFEAADGQLYEAPEGGKAYPTERNRNEL